MQHQLTAAQKKEVEQALGNAQNGTVLARQRDARNGEGYLLVCQNGQVIKQTYISPLSTTDEWTIDLISKQQITDIQEQPRTQTAR